MTIEEAEELLFENGDEYKTIVCVKKKGYRINYRKYNFEDVRLMVECIYASRFISKEKSEELTELLKEFVSEEKYKEVKSFHDFRVIRENDKKNLIFDIEVCPTRLSRPNDSRDLLSYIENDIKKKAPEYNCIITVDLAL